MAELLEVLVLRMENCEQQQQEVSQLRTQVTKLQQCCQLVRRGGYVGLTPPVMALCDPRRLFPAPTFWSSQLSRAQRSCPSQSRSWGRPQRAPHILSLHPKKGTKVFQEPGHIPAPPPPPRSTHLFGLFHVTSYLNGCQRLTDGPGNTCQKQGVCGSGAPTAWGSRILGPFSMGLRQKL